MKVYFKTMKNYAGKRVKLFVVDGEGQEVQVPEKFRFTPESVCLKSFVFNVKKSIKKLKLTCQKQYPKKNMLW